MKCPNCHEDITDLRCFSLLWREDRFTVEQIEDGEHIKPKYEPDQICLSEPVNVEFVCPECDATLFNNEQSAIAFLKGEKVGVENNKQPDGYKDVLDILNGWTAKPLPLAPVLKRSIMKAMQALQDCLEIGLDGKGE